MIRSRLGWPALSLAVLGLILAAGPVAGQMIYGTGASATGFGNITGTFGATGYGTGGFYGGRFGGYSHLSLGISGGSGGLSGGSWNRYGRLSNMNAKDLASVLPKPFPEENVAHLRVIVPTADTELWVNDTLMKKKGKSRTFISPFLEPNKHFLYDLKVRYRTRDGRQVELLRTVTVEAGSQDIVDFTVPEGSAPTVSRVGRELGLGTDR